MLQFTRRKQLHIYTYKYLFVEAVRYMLVFVFLQDLICCSILKLSPHENCTSDSVIDLTALSVLSCVIIAAKWIVQLYVEDVWRIFAFMFNLRLTPHENCTSDSIIDLTALSLCCTPLLCDNCELFSLSGWCIFVEIFYDGCLHLSS